MVENMENIRIKYKRIELSVRCKGFQEELYWIHAESMKDNIPELFQEYTNALLQNSTRKRKEITKEINFPQTS